MCDIGEQRRTIYIEPIEEPAITQVEEPSPDTDPVPSLDRPDHQPEHAR
jgi:hypothetical protein